MALTKVSTDGVKDDAITKTKIPANQIEASELADNAVDTNAIADQAVALSKLPHGTSSNDGKFLRANNGADPTFETVNTDLVSDTTPQLGGDLDTNSHHIHMDNLHAIRWGHTNTPMYFQMFHESGYGMSMQNGNGAFYIQNATGNDNNIIVRAKSGEDSIKAFANGRVELYHDNSKKLETSSIGINIFGDSTVGVNTSTHGNLHFVSPSDNASARYSRIRKNYNSPFNMEYFASTSSSDQNHVFYSDLTTERVRFQKTGGISFNGDTAAANALDDYEEGTWTPTLHGTWYNSGTFNNAVYTKIGRLVTVSFDLFQNSNNMGWQSGASIRGFPFGVYSSGYITTATLTTFSYTSSSARFVENYFDSYSGGNLYLHTNSQSSNIRHLWCSLTYTSTT